MTDSTPLTAAILSSLAARPFSTDELHAMPSVRAASGSNIAKVAQELGALQQRGLVGRQSRNWALTAKGRSTAKPDQASPKSRSTIPSRGSPIGPPPSASNPVETLSGSRFPARNAPTQASPTIPPRVPQPAAHAKTPARWSAPWEPFHKLLQYYIRCVEEDERPGLNCLYEDIGKTWIPIPHTREWSKSGDPSLTLPLMTWMSDFFRLAAQANDLPDFYYGYPVETFSWIDKEDASLRTFLTPALLQPVNVTTEGGRLNVQMRDTPRLNERWLEGHFYKEPKEAILSAVRAAPDHGIGTLARMVEILSPFLRNNRTIQRPDPSNLRPLPSNFDGEPNGLRNSAILISSKKLKYSRGLLAELRWIRDHAPESELEKTALRFFFRATPRSETKALEPRHSSAAIGLVATEPQFRISGLNSEQRTAVSAASTEPVTLILGPPGTGKTDVGAAIAIQQFLAKRSVLFCSRNHAAVREFASRCNGIPNCPPLVVQPGADGQPATYADAVIQILNVLAPESLKKAGSSPDLERLQTDASRTSVVLRELEQGFSIHRTQHEHAAKARGRIDRLANQVPEHLKAISATPEFPTGAATKIGPMHDAIDHLRTQLSTDGWSADNLIAMLRGWMLSVATGGDSRILASALGLEPVPALFKLHERLKWLQFASLVSDFATAHAEIRCAESTLSGARAMEQLAAAWQKEETRLIEITRAILPVFFGCRIERLSPDALQELLGLQPVLRSKDGKGLGEKLKGAINRRVQAAFPVCLQVLPLWAVTNLSLRRCIPLSPAAFDLAVIDEASQCDIASAIPVLFRAKRAAIIGDRFQLSHTTRLPLDRDGVIFGETGFEDPDSLIFRYAANSLYDLADYRLNLGGIGRKVMLREHYRCHEEIIGFCSDTFYPEPLRVRTEVARLRVPAGRAAGLHWTHLVSMIEKGSDGGCRSQAEAEACVREVVSLIRDRGFAGSIGIVTPFKAQKILLRQLVEQSLNSAELARCPVLADTAHGFQGGQRDVVLMSLVLGPDTPDGSKYFLSEGKNLFNVAISRAAAVLHVVGNLEYAEQCGIAHVVKFARYFKAKQARQQLQSKPPVPDKWENILHDLLEKAGIKTIRQHHVDGRFLDLAYIEAPRKIDIEVDGVATHLTEAGNRVDDDLWRDLRLQAQGWEVARFWVCQVRDQPDQCVSRIKNLIQSKKPLP